MSASHERQEPLLLRVDLAAQRLGISTATCYRLVAAGEIATVRFGRAHRVPVAELERLIARRLKTTEGGTSTSKLSDRPAGLLPEVAG